MNAPRVFLDGRVTLHRGDCREVIRSLPDASIDACVTDPPYALVSIGKRFGAENAAPAKVGKSVAYARASAGFMGKRWDTGEVAFDPAFWADVLRVLKPGAHLVAFAGTGTTGEAAFREGFRAILIEREAEYQADIARRMALCLAGPDERARESLKARGKADYDAGPLFGGDAA